MVQRVIFDTVILFSWDNAGEGRDPFLVSQPDLLYFSYFKYDETFFSHVKAVRDNDPGLKMRNSGPMKTRTEWLAAFRADLLVTTIEGQKPGAHYSLFAKVEKGYPRVQALLADLNKDFWQVHGDLQTTDPETKAVYAVSRMICGYPYRVLTHFAYERYDGAPHLRKLDPSSNAKEPIQDRVKLSTGIPLNVTLHLTVKIHSN